MMAMSTAVGEPLKKGKKMSAGRRAASRLSSGRWGSRLQVFPAQAANQPGLPSAEQPHGQLGVDESAPDESAPHRRRKHQKSVKNRIAPSAPSVQRSLCNPQSQAEFGQEDRWLHPASPCGTAARTRAPRMLLGVQKRLAYCRSCGKLLGSGRRVHQGS